MQIAKPVKAKKAKKVKAPKQVTFGQFTPPATAPCSAKPPEAFVYKVTFEDGYYYIGCKGMDKNWKTYTTSSKHLKRNYKATYEILEWCICKSQAKQHEQALIIKHIVDDKNLNYAIDSRKYLDKLNKHKKQGIVK